MGFFSSRKSEDNDGYVISALGNANEKSVVNVIRSRFYGKHKGKEREEHSPQSFHTHGASPAQTLSGTSLPATPHASDPTAYTIKSKSAGSATRTAHHGRSSPSSRDNYNMDNTITMPPTPTPKPRDAASTGKKSPRPSSLVQQAPRKAADAVTMTLAQRLNELAAANSEGLLNDDEYRILRQNLFERFSSGAVVPTEKPFVPVSRPRANTDNPTEGRSTTRPLSNFQIDAPHTPSLQSKIQTSSGMPGFLRRSTSKRTPTQDPNTSLSDTSSIFSATSTQSRGFKLSRILSKKSSSSSIVTQTDAMSVSSRRTGIGSDRSHSEHNAHGTSYFSSPSHSRSTASSVRRFATPPSSFPARVPGGEAKYTGKITDVFDDENPKTAQQIREEILSVEAESKRLMDAFSGLELTTLARLQRREGRPTGTDEGGQVESTWTLIPDSRSQRRIKIADSDAGSVISGTSAHTGPSMRSAAASRKGSRMGVPSTGSIHRKNSISSIASQERRTPKIASAMAPPPVPALSHSRTYFPAGNASNASLVRSVPVPMSAVPENGVNMAGEMDDIRRRREEVRIRYDARLEYLRAKLKGAQLHEKLLRR